MRATLRQRDSHARGETATADCVVLKFKHTITHTQKYETTKKITK